MKKYFLLIGLLLLIAVPIVAQFAPILLPDLQNLVKFGSQRVMATLENGMTVLFMLSAFYMIGKNFMFQKQIDHIKDKVRLVLDNLRPH